MKNKPFWLGISSAVILLVLIGATIVFANAEGNNVENERTNQNGKTVVETEYKEWNPQTNAEETKKGIMYKTDGSGATKFVDNEILEYVDDRSEATKALLEHSYQVIDAYILGVAEVQGLGDFQLSAEEVASMLTENHNIFKTLYAEELERGAAIVLNTDADGSSPWAKHKDSTLVRMVLEIDKAFTGAVDNLSWSNTEAPDPTGIDEEAEYWDTRQLDGDTRFMKARDVMQRYSTWMFGGKIAPEGIKLDELPIPERFSDLVK